MEDLAASIQPPRLSQYLTAYPETLFSDELYRCCEGTDRYALEWALELAAQLELASALSQPRTTEEVHAHLRWSPGFRAAGAWLLRHLAAADFLAVDDAEPARRYRLSAPLPEAQRQAVRQQCLAISAATAATLDLYDAAAGLYPAVARGEVRGDEAMFSPQRAGLWAAYFDNGNPVYAINNRVAAHAVAARWPTHPARVLELGAGFGSASRAVLEEVAHGGQSLQGYTVTEPSSFFRRRAERMLRATFPQANLSFAALDMNLPWQPQGIAAGSQDLILAVNVLHVAQDLRFSLREALTALAPGGWLVLGECLRPFPDQTIPAELIFQILDGFTQVTTDPETRPTHGFLTPEQWRRALVAAGFEATAIEPDVAAIREFFPRFFTGAIRGRRPL